MENIFDYKFTNYPHFLIEEVFFEKIMYFKVKFFFFYKNFSKVVHIAKFKLSFNYVH